MHVREKIRENNAYAGNDDESVDEKRERENSRTKGGWYAHRLIHRLDRSLRDGRRGRRGGCAAIVYYPRGGKRMRANEHGH